MARVSSAALDVRRQVLVALVAPAAGDPDQLEAPTVLLVRGGESGQEVLDLLGRALDQLRQDRRLDRLVGDHDHSLQRPAGLVADG